MNSKMRMRVSPALLTLFVSVNGTVVAQERADQRREWLTPQTQVSDDPRRVPVRPAARGPEGSIVLKGGRVFDAVSTEVREATVVIERNQIKAILPASSTQWPSDARVIDVTGKTVMPGLIDLHTHLSYSEPDTPSIEDDDEGAGALRGMERLRYYLLAGVTSVRDVASMGNVPFVLKRWVAANRIAGPRVFAAGQLITGTGGHGAEHLWSVGCHAPATAIREASGPDDWREAVREQFKRGADLIKLASHYSREEVVAAVDEAHALGLKVAVDAETFYIQWAVEAGVDTVEHPLPRSPPTLKLMASKHAAAVPTLVPYIYIFDDNGGYFGSTSRRFSFSKAANLEMFVRMRRAGVQMGVGTDLVSDWFRHLPQAYLTELQQFVAGGYTPAQALVAATRTSAEILDMQDKLGTLTAGKLADVLVIDGRPETDLRDLLKVAVVIRDGRVVVEDGRVQAIPQIVVPEPTPRNRS